MRARQIGNGARQIEHPAVGSRGEVEMLHRHPQEVLGQRLQMAEHSPPRGPGSFSSSTRGTSRLMPVPTTDRVAD